MDIHSAYFDNKQSLALIADVLRGLDRSVLETLGRTTGVSWPPKLVPA